MRVFEIQPFSNFNFLVYFSWSWFRLNSSKFQASSKILGFSCHCGEIPPCPTPEILHSPCHKHRGKVCPSGKHIWSDWVTEEKLKKKKYVYQTLGQNNHSATSIKKIKFLQKYNMLEGLMDTILYLLRIQPSLQHPFQLWWFKPVTLKTHPSALFDPSSSTPGL